MRHTTTRLFSIICLLTAGALGTLPVRAGAPNLPPVAGDDAITTRTQGRPITISTLLDNDTDPNGDTLTLTDISQPSHGTVSLSDNIVIFTPNRSFAGEDAFQYVVSDGRGGAAIGSVTIRNPFLINAGSYGALISGETPAHENAGYIQLKVSGGGAFSAQVRFAGDVFRFKAQFALDGTFDGDLVSDAGTRTLTLQFPVDGGAAEITGDLAGVAFTAPLNPFSRTNPAPRIGRFTVLLPPAQILASIPQGNGFGSIKISASGRAGLLGKLGDGQRWSSASLLMPDGSLPIYAAIYNKPGSIFGTAAFEDVPGFARLSGTLEWFKPSIGSARLYRRGFRTTTDLIGSSYVPPEISGFPLALIGATPNAQFTAAAGGLRRARNERSNIPRRPAAGPYDVAIENVTKIAAKLRIDSRTGVFRGTFLDTRTKSVRRFHGVLVQSENFGAGVFQGLTTSGRVELKPTE